MRIAVAGSHATGKSTLVTALAARWPSSLAVDEAYVELAASGIESHELGADTFEPQLIRSLELLRAPGQPDAIFDRSPVDYMAYLRVVEPSWDIGGWLPRVREALATLDCVVFVPIESPDLIPVSADEHPRVRKRVDQLLREVLLEDAWGLGMQACEVTGPVARRVAQVEAHCGRLGLR